MVQSPRQRLTLPIAPSVAGIVGLLAAAGLALLPGGTLESLMVDSGIASLVSAAAPALGLTGRLVVAGAGGGVVALVVWFTLFLGIGTRAFAMQPPMSRTDGAPVLRRADAHPDAPARAPLLAHRDLGTPFLEVRARATHDAAEDVVETVSDTVVAVVAAPLPPVERALPTDLDQPLAAFDPGALPDRPLGWSPMPVRVQALAPGERLEAFALSQPAPSAARGDPALTIHALLDRLERSVSRRDGGPVRRDVLDDPISNLRKMATRSA